MVQSKAMVSACMAASLAAACSDSSPPSRPLDAGMDSDAMIGEPERDYRDESLYLVMIDRFENGDPSNDSAGDPSCLQPESDLAFHGGDLLGLSQRLDYIQELGVSSVWTTPLYESSSCGSHGYWPAFRNKDDGALEPKFGSATELTAVIAQLGQRGMGLYLDMVVNHAGYDAPIVTERPSWFHTNDDCAQGPEETQCPLAGLPDFAHEQAEVGNYLRNVSLSWLERFDIAGVRMDTAKHVPLGYFRDSWLPSMQRARPGLRTIAEVFDESSAAALAPYQQAGFTSAFHFPMRRVILETIGGGATLDRLAAQVRETIDTVGMDNANRLTNFLSNHDVPRWIDALEEGLSDDQRLARYRLALIATITLPGVPQLYAGDELCLRGQWPENRRDIPAWAWSEQTRRGEHPESLGDGQECFALSAGLLGLRNRESALRRGHYVELWSQGGGPEVFGFYRHDGMSRVVVLLNAGTSATGDLHIPLRGNPGMNPGERDALSEGRRFEEQLGMGAADELTIADGHIVVDLPPMSAAIYLLPPLGN